MGRSSSSVLTRCLCRQAGDPVMTPSPTLPGAGPSPLASTPSEAFSLHGGAGLRLLLQGLGGQTLHPWPPTDATDEGPSRWGWGSGDPRHSPGRSAGAEQVRWASVRPGSPLSRTGVQLWRKLCWASFLGTQARPETLTKAAPKSKVSRRPSRPLSQRPGTQHGGSSAEHTPLCTDSARGAGAHFLPTAHGVSRAIRHACGESRHTRAAAHTSSEPSENPGTSMLGGELQGSPHTPFPHARPPSMGDTHVPGQ